LTASPRTGSVETAVFNGVGALAWTVAIVAAVLALRDASARRGVLFALGAGALMLMHVPPPIGPVVLLCLAGTAHALRDPATVPLAPAEA
jgi:hypothetical protein